MERDIFNKVYTYEIEESDLEQVQKEESPTSDGHIRIALVGTSEAAKSYLWMNILDEAESPPYIFGSGGINLSQRCCEKKHHVRRP